jgi:hypothetical protein
MMKIMLSCEKTNTRLKEKPQLIHDDVYCTCPVCVDDGIHSIKINKPSNGEATFEGLLHLLLLSVN